MKRGLFYLLMVLFILVNISGCVPLIIGGTAGVVGACAISKDTIQGDTDKSFGSLWEAALNIARTRGNIKQENRDIGEIDYQENASKVTIRLVRLTQATVRMKVTARKHHFPDLQLAQDVYTRIIDETR